MTKIITINENAMIEIIPANYRLRYKIKTRNKQTKWNRGEYFPNLKSLAKEYLNNAPQHTTQTIESFGKLIEVIKTAEANLSKAIEKINQ